MATGAPAGRGGRLIGRAVVLLVLAMGIAAVGHWRVGLDPTAIAAAIRDHPAAPVAFLGLHIVASLLFVPRTVLAAAAGLVFGVVWGVVWAATGSVLGAVAGFWLARYINLGLIDLERNPSLAPMLGRIRHGGWRAVALLRLVPVVPHSLANYSLGLMPIALLPYALGSLVGQMPMTIACVALGAAGERLAAGQAGWLVPSALGATALALSWLVPVLARRRPS